MTLRNTILNMARRRKSGVTAGDVIQKTGKGRSSVSAALTELANDGKLLWTTAMRKSIVSGKQNTVYSYNA